MAGTINAQYDQMQADIDPMRWEVLPEAPRLVDHCYLRNSSRRKILRL